MVGADIVSLNTAGVGVTIVLSFQSHGWKAASGLLLNQSNVSVSLSAVAEADCFSVIVLKYKYNL